MSRRISIRRVVASVGDVVATEILFNRGGGIVGVQTQECVHSMGIAACVLGCTLFVLSAFVLERLTNSRDWKGGQKANN
jgi:hypothetical protein